MYKFKKILCWFLTTVFFITIIEGQNLIINKDMEVYASETAPTLLVKSAKSNLNSLNSPSRVRPLVGNFMVTTGQCFTIGLVDNGSVIAAGSNSYGQLNTTIENGFSNIVAVAAGLAFTVGLKQNGTVVAVGDNNDGQCNTTIENGFSDIVAISAGRNFTVSLKQDGTVVAVGDNTYGQCNTTSENGFSDIVAISAGYSFTVGLKQDGTIVTVGLIDHLSYTDIINIAAGGNHVVALKSDGTVIAFGGNNYWGQCNTFVENGFSNIVSISGNYFNSAALRNDGSVVVTGASPSPSECNLENIEYLSSGSSSLNLVGIRYDGSVVGIGYNSYGENNLENWNLKSNHNCISGVNAKDNISKYDPSMRSDLSFSSDPVDTASGAHVIERDVLNLKGAVDIPFNLTYNSLLLNEGSLGKGWGHNYETYLGFESVGSITVHWNANRSNALKDNGNGTYSCLDRSSQYDVLIQNPDDGSYTLTRNDQTVYKFNPEGKLNEQLNSHGQTLLMTYDENVRLSKVADPISGKSLTFHYTNALLYSVTDSLNRETAFTYDDKHNLTSITDAEGNTTSYTYNTDGQVLTATDKDGRQLFINTYDELGRVATQDDGVDGNGLTYFTYDETTELGNIITKVIDRNGNTRTYTHDNQYQLLNIKDELGNDCNSYTYDENGNMQSSTDGKGNTSTFTYDDRGNLLTSTNPAGSITLIAYDDHNNVLSIQTPDNGKTMFEYDEFNNITKATDPIGNINEYTYDENHQVKTKVLQNGGVFTYTYENGMLKSVTDPTGVITTYSYDAAGRMVSQQDGAGNTTTFTYDDNDNLLSATDPLGDTVSYTYDCHNKVLTKTDANGNVTTFQYDGNGNLISSKDPFGSITNHQYDGEGHLICITDPNGNETYMSYDKKGRLLTKKDPEGNITSYTYDQVDNLIKTEDPLGNTVSIEYDNLYNPTVYTDQLGGKQTNHYDSVSNPIEITDPLGRETNLSYNSLNKITSVTDPMNGTSAQNFDANENIIDITDPNGNKTGFSYDLAGRLTSETMQSGDIIHYEYNDKGLLSKKINARGQETTYRYDEASRLDCMTYPEGTTTCTYDASGNLLTQTDNNGALAWVYDELNRPIQYTDVSGNTIKYSYGEAGSLTKLTYPGGKEVAYGYNKNNFLTSVTDWEGRETSYTYNANGKLIKVMNPDGSVLDMEYDAKGQVTSRVEKDSEGSSIIKYSYTYDAAGNVTKEDIEGMQEQNGSLANQSQTILYSQDNRMDTVNGQTVEYDADGNMAKGPLGNGEADFTFDSQNRLIKAGNITFIYDAKGNRIGIKEGEITTNYVINPNTMLTQVLMKDEGNGNVTYYLYGLGLIGQENPDGSFNTYHYDRRGSTVAITDDLGSVTDTYSYGPYGELLGREGASDTPFLYNGRDGVVTDPNGLYFMRARYYNPDIKRFINRDVLTGNINNDQSLNRYAYVNGQPINSVDPYGLLPTQLQNGLNDIYDVYFREYKEDISSYNQEMDYYVGADKSFRFKSFAGKGSNLYYQTVLLGLNIADPFNLGKVTSRITTNLTCDDPTIVSESKQINDNIMDIASSLNLIKDSYKLVSNMPDVLKDFEKTKAIIEKVKGNKGLESIYKYRNNVSLGEMLEPQKNLFEEILKGLDVTKSSGGAGKYEH